MTQRQRTAETISFEDLLLRTHAEARSRKTIDIVKAGFTGLHDRWILNTTLKTDRMNPLFGSRSVRGDVSRAGFLSGHGTNAERSSVKARASGGCLGTHRRLSLIHISEPTRQAEISYA